MSDFLHLAADFLGDLSRLRPSRRPVPQSKTFLFQASCNKRATSGGGGVWRAVGKSLLEREREREREEDKKNRCQRAKIRRKTLHKIDPEGGESSLLLRIGNPEQKKQAKPSKP